MSSVYARIEISDESVEKLEGLGLDVGEYTEGADEYLEQGQTWFSCPMEGGGTFLDELEKLGYPVPITGFRETDSLHTSYVFVCPGDGTYFEVQADEGGGPVVSVYFDEDEEMVVVNEASAIEADNYFKAMRKFYKEVEK
ncbi:MAG: hypothetical protein WC279_14755 [Sulfurimonas sp.]|jgi:hypothetical protein|uniref:hypothetical protein n=1 Tax=Sulfurimonas sp. TaxID=2022749 RepID=UPI00356629BE|nr:hypothetical protein [Dehalococcoidia bacterium]